MSEFKRKRGRPKKSLLKKELERLQGGILPTIEEEKLVLQKAQEEAMEASQQQLIDVQRVGQAKRIRKDLGRIETNKNYSDTDHFYYNVVIPHNDQTNPGSGSIAQFLDTRSQALVQNPSEWEMAIIRFQVPTSSIPIHVFVPNVYSLELSFGAFDSGQVFLIYTPDNSLAPPPTGTVNQLFIYSYQQWVDMINTALATAFTNLGANVPAGATSPPYLIYDSTTNLISMVLQQAYVVTQSNFNTANLNIYFNTSMQTFFPSFRWFFHGYNQSLGKDYSLVIKNNFNNLAGNNVEAHPVVPPMVPTGTPGAGTSAYIMTEEFPSLFAWNAPQSIVFISNGVPFRQEYLTQSQTITSGQVSSASNAQLPILTDFIPVVSPGGFDWRTNIQFFNQGEYRLIDMKGDNPLYNFDISIFWQDNFQVLYPIILQPHEVATIKILFRKKNTKGGLGYSSQ